MSSEAVDWALKFKGITASQRMVLLGLAHHADPSGKRSYPSLATLAGYAELSDRQVRRLLRQLEEKGVVRRGSRSAVAHLAPDKRPIVYELPDIPRRADRLSGGTNGAARGDISGVAGGHLDVRQNPYETPMKPRTRPKADSGRFSPGSGIILPYSKATA